MIATASTLLASVSSAADFYFLYFSSSVATLRDLLEKVLHIVQKLVLLFTVTFVLFCIWV